LNAKPFYHHLKQILLFLNKLKQQLCGYCKQKAARSFDLKPEL